MAPRDTLTRRADEVTDPTDYIGVEQGKTRRIDRMNKEESPASSRRGWAAFNEAAAKKAEEGFPERFTLGDENEAVLMVFLEDQPLQVWEEHWIQEAPGKRKSFACLPSVNEDAEGCPFCDELDDKPSLLAAFNVAVLDEGTWKLKVLVGRTRVVKAVQAHANGRTTSPINKDGLYFEAYKTGTGTESTPHFNRMVESLGEVSESEVIPPETMTELKSKLWAQYAFAPKADDVRKVVDAVLRS